MRKALLLVAVFGFIGSLRAADPFVGTWKLNVAKSTIPPGPTAPKELTVVIRELGDQYDVSQTGTQTDGKPISTKYMGPRHGGVIKVQQPAVPEGISVISTLIAPDNVYSTVLKEGKQVQVDHSVVSKDGKTMTTTTSGTDAQGGPVEALFVWERQ
jgi:hypothetical protein